MHRRLAFILRNGVVLSIFQIIFVGTTSNAYSIGDVDPRALRGVWRLTSLDEEGLPFERHKQLGRGFFPRRSAASPDPKTIWRLRGFLPMKEFTTYPKKKISDINDGFLSPVHKKQTEIFIKLKDDHTFQQCTSLQFSDGADEKTSLEEELEMEVFKREKESFAWKGTWDFVHGKLILAADRPEKKPFSVYDGDYDNGEEKGGLNADTILVGKVAVQSDTSLKENPVLEQRQVMSEDDKEQASSGLIEMSDQADASASRPKDIDVHLSVPKGKIKTGKFMYPKTHPSFFEQPIYRPESKGRFELRQILGDYNAKLADDTDGDLVELFRKKDLVEKRFYLSTFPLPKRRKKFERWDVNESRYIQEEYEPSLEQKKEEELEPGKNMQVMAVELFANNTFSTLYGLGSSTVLRGKWSITGEKRDQLWMMVYRFGFGRSVSGSTFSEGKSLTQNDEKGYWGKIKEVQPSNEHSKKIEIKGAVMVGWGLEPCSVGRFKMIEMEDYILEEDDDTDEEEEDEAEEISADDVIENAKTLDSILRTEESDVGDVSDPFDTAGAFE